MEPLSPRSGENARNEFSGPTAYQQNGEHQKQYNYFGIPTRVLVILLAALVVLAIVAYLGITRLLVPSVSRSIQDPFHVDVRAINEDLGGMTWVFQDAISLDDQEVIEQLDPDPSGSQVPDWNYVDEQITDLGGIRVPLFCADPESPCAGSGKYQIVLTGNWDQRVRIRDIEAVVQERSPAPSAARVEIQGEGVENAESIVFNLDADEPVALALEDGLLAGNYFDGKAIHLENGEPIPINVTTYSGECWCRWEIIVHISTDGIEDSITVRADGTENGPFFESLGVYPEASDYVLDYEYDYMVQRFVEVG
ncbi:hypothetical protein [Nocardiopsis sp. YSL2]|uniref:hypothetical protein n=1 Tax=Nocardiopsis sp. YSL2 TaxID=2939492 RepID=UPI0026F47634|nr:hypothetical protein [Nocardiopsis sp. YSL2]